MHRSSEILLCVLLWVAVSQGQSSGESAFTSIWDSIVSKWKTLLSFLFKNRLLSVWRDNVTQAGRDQFFVTSIPRLDPRRMTKAISSLLTSCRRNIPNRPEVVRIEYESEEPRIRAGGKATIVSTGCTTSHTAECVGGLWQYQPYSYKNCSILLIGGISSSGSLEWFNPWFASENRLLATRLLTQRWWHISAVLDDGRVLIAGGGADGRRDLSSVELFDPKQEMVTWGPDMSTKRFAAAAAVLDGVVFVCGGWDGSRVLRSCERFRSGAWESIAPMSTKRTAFAMVALEGNLYAIGGRNGSRDLGQDLSSVEAYNITRNSWTRKAPMTTARRALAAAIWENSIIACGGPGKNVCEKYDVGADRWTAIAPMNNKRFKTNLMAVGDWLVAVGGGERPVEIYNPTKDRWSVHPHSRPAQTRICDSAVII